MKNILLLPGRHPIKALIAVVLISAVAVLPAQTVEVNVSVESFLPEQGEDLRFYQHVMDRFGSDKFALIHIQDPDLFTPKRLRKLHKLHNSVKKLDTVKTVTSLFTIPALTSEGGSFNTRPVLTDIPETRSAARVAKQTLLQHRLAADRIIFGDGNQLIFFLTLPSGGKDTDFFRRIYNQLDAEIAPIRGSFERIYQFGAPFLYYEFARKIRSGLFTILPLSFVIGIMIMFGFNRDWRAAALPVLTTIIASVWTLGFMGLLGISLNLLTWIVPVLIFTIGSTEDLHLLNGYQRMTGSDQKEAFAQSLSLPVFLTFITTFLGFLVIALNDASMIRDFAFSASFGMVANFIVTILAVPPVLFHTTAHQTASDWQNPVIRLLQLLNQYPKTILAAGVFVLVGACVALPSIEIGNNFREYFDRDEEARVRWRRFTRMAESNGSFYYIAKTTDETDLLTDRRVAFLQNARTLIGRQDGLKYNLSIFEPIDQLHEGFKGHSLPSAPDPNLVDQLLLILPERIVGQYLSPDRKEALFAASYTVGSTAAMMRVINAGKKTLQQHAPPGVTIRATGQNVLLGRVSNTLPRQQVATIALLIVAVSILIGLTFYSVRAILFALPTNALPVFVLFGSMGALGVNLDLSTALVSTILIGLSVDDTIHFLACFYDYDKDRSAIPRTVRAEFLPVTTTSFAIIASLLTLTMGPFPPIRWFAGLMALSVFAAYLADVLLLPALLSLFSSSQTN